MFKSYCVPLVPLCDAQEGKNIMKYLITGGAGFIGSHIAQTLLARGETVRILDNFSTGKRENIEVLTKLFGP